MLTHARWVAPLAAFAVLFTATPAEGAPRPASDRAVDTAVDAAPAAEIPGIEKAGPLATVRGDGPLAPQLPQALATVPGPPASSGDAPWLLLKQLKDDPATYRVRVYDASRGRGLDAAEITDTSFGYDWEGTVTGGWGRITAQLAAGHGYVVWLRDPEGRWVEAGRFAVRGSVDPAGPTTTAGGMTATIATGELTWAWESAGLVGPAPGVAVGLRWKAAQQADPGLPAGWQYAVNSGSPWMSIEEAGQRTKALIPPARPVADRVARNRVEVSFAYDLAGREKPNRFVIDELVSRNGKARWQRVASAPLAFAMPSVDRTVRITPGARQVRVGVLSEGAIAYSPSAPIVDNPVPPLTTAQPEGDICRSAVLADASPESVMLRGWNGMSLTFLRNAWGVYEQVYGGEQVPGYRSTLSMCPHGDGSNAWLFTDSSGVVTRFEDGHAVSVVSRGQPVATMRWQDGRLEAITNGIGRTIALTYAGQATCPASSWAGFAATPAGLLCRIAYPDGTNTEIGYVGDGLRAPQIALVKDPGNSGTTLGWDSAGRIVATRSTLASRAATSSEAAKSAVARATYDADGRVRTLVEAPSTPGAASLTQTLQLPGINEAILRAGSPVEAVVRGTASGYAMSNTAWVQPDTLQASRFSDASNLTVKSRSQDNVTTSIDSRGLETRIEYDDFGNVVSQSGPIEPGRQRTGTQVEATYDTRRVDGRDQAYEGMAVTRFDGEGFTGPSHADYWKPVGSRGLAVEWQGLPSPMSAIAGGIWTPNKAEDEASTDDTGWAFEISSSSDADVRLIVEGQPCVGSCTIKGLPTGPKHVTLEITRGGSSGSVSVKASMAGRVPQPIPSAQVVPGFNNRTRTESNDTYSGSAPQPATDFAYGEPETGQVTRVNSPGGLSSTMAYEGVDPARGQWGRLTTYTTPGGLTQTTQYWPNTGTVALPAPCTGTAVLSGQAKSITRQDGSTITWYHDMNGRELASVTTGRDGGRETVCTTYFGDGSLKASSSYDASDRLIESVVNEFGIGGDPLTVRQTVTHGDAAPIDAGETKTSTTTVDLRGKPLRYVDEAGSTTVTTYTASGDPQTVAITLAGQSAPILTFAYAYRASDAALTGVTVNGVPAADVAYGSGTGEVQSVSFAGGAARMSLGYDVNGRPDRVSFAAGADRYASDITFTEFGRIASAALYSPAESGKTPDKEVRTYSYDEAGRLVDTRIATMPQGGTPTRTTYSYGYARSQDSSCGSSYAGAAADALRTGGARNGVAYVSCHDGRGRLASTTDPLVTGDPTGKGKATLEHDELGRVVAVRGAARPLELTWASGTQVARVAEGTVADLVATVLSTYGGRLVDKTVTTTQGAQRVRYSYTGSASASPTAVLSVEGDKVTGVAELTYPLPGGARVTIPAGGTPTLTVADLQGAAVATFSVPTLAVDSVSGGTAPVGLGLAPRFGPYGEPIVEPSLTGTAAPTYAWQMTNRHETLQGSSSGSLLGARPYLPALGEFLAPDPLVDAGTNLYSYTPADPVNGVDRTGQANEWSWFWQIVSVVLVVAAIVVDVAAPFFAPATGAGLAAWFTWAAVSMGTSYAISYLAGKAQEQSIRLQEESSTGLDVVRMTAALTQLLETVIMIGIPVVKFAARIGTKLVRYVKSVFRPSRVDLPFEIGTGPHASLRSLPSARSSVTFSVLIEEAPAFSNGARESVMSGVGRLSTGSQKPFTVEGNRSAIAVIENYLT
ncbi:MAG: RHS repeat-associated core domain-containing protein [bacterium]